ncbi:hypothetical protein [Nocardia sp. alder85J]|uniref:hypothetical protein n=1 Tax=Nocardia sp. alder85J TaxID=2862949 RepID=UPI001CD3885E|nr:hypothetical protein [Nocardia sp. alder85J]MCX4091344.1 hypothetical protein [Nocardia sp. alder85J]
MTDRLPGAFAELEPYADRWCLPTEAQRYRRRLDSSMAELLAFYDAFFPRAEEAIEYCDKFSLDELPEDALNLLYLLYSLITVAMAVEIFRQPKVVDAANAVLDRVGEPIP